VIAGKSKSWFRIDEAQTTQLPSQNLKTDSVAQRTAAADPLGNQHWETKGTAASRQYNFAQGKLHAMA
jgi:hypothetical protein